MDCRSDEELEAVNSLSSEEYEAKIKKVHTQSQSVVHIRANLNAKSLLVPKVGKMKARKLEFIDTKSSVKVLLYRALIAAYNYAFFNDFSAVSCKDSFAKTAPFFVDWLNIKKGRK